VGAWAANYPEPRRTPTGRPDIRVARVTSSARPVSLRHRGASVAVGMAGMNVATYIFTALAARVLGPQSYGALASLLAVLLVISVIQLGIQTTAARRIAADPTHVGQIEREILSLTYRAAAVVGIALLLLTPVLNALLKLDSLATASIVGLTAVPLTIVGGQLGVLQGERRWWPVAMVYLACGVPRLVIGTALILWKPTELAAMTGVFLGAVVPVVVGAYALRRTRPPSEHAEHHSSRAIIREILSNSQTLLAFLALMNCDVIVARNVLDGHVAGLYAGGLILTKALLFLPQFVVVVAFPAMSTAHERRGALLRGLAFVLGLGVAGVLGCAALPKLALIFVGGDEYADIDDRLWLFAVLGTVLSLLQLLIYAVLARQGTRSVYFVWLALAGVLAVGSQATTLIGLLTTVATIDAALFLVLLAISLRRLRNPVTGEEPPPEAVM
jgi:O-antigen/teichoic acid export membrane protein